MHSLESLSKITWDHPSREAFWTNTWEFTITTMPVDFLGTAAIAVEDVAVAASEFTLIQTWGGGVQHGLWSCLGFWRSAVREGRTLVLFPRFSCWTSECKVGPHCVKHRSWDPITKIIVKVMKDCWISGLGDAGGDNTSFMMHLK